MASIYDTIVSAAQTLGLEYRIESHEPVFTSDVAARVCSHPPRQGTKTVLATDGARLVLITVPTNAKIDFRRVQRHFNLGRLSIPRDPSLFSRLGLPAGGLPPFGLPPDVLVCVSPSLCDEPHVYLNPGLNDKTLVVSGPAFRALALHFGAVFFDIAKSTE